MCTRVGTKWCSSTTSYTEIKENRKKFRKKRTSSIWWKQQSNTESSYSQRYIADLFMSFVICERCRHLSAVKCRKTESFAMAKWKRFSDPIRKTCVFKRREVQSIALTNLLLLLLKCEYIQLQTKTCHWTCGNLHTRNRASAIVRQRHREMKFTLIPRLSRGLFKSIRLRKSENGIISSFNWQSDRALFAFHLTDKWTVITVCIVCVFSISFRFTLLKMNDVRWSAEET